MKEVFTISDDLFRIISEPGDATRYDYIVFKTGDIYRFMSIANSFKYPRELGYWDVKNIEVVQDCISFAIEGVNPYTVLECVRTIKQLQEL